MASPPSPPASEYPSLLDDVPTIRELMLHANVKTNWYQLGIQLIDPGDLNVIDIENHLVADKLSSTYDKWLKSDSKATRKTVIEALVKIGELELAREYEKCLNVPSTCSIVPEHTQSSLQLQQTLSPLQSHKKFIEKADKVLSKDPEICDIVARLEEQFSALIVAVKTKFTTEDHVKNAKLYIQSLLQGCHANQDVIAVHLINLDNASNADDLFKYLVNQRFLAYLNYVLLENLFSHVLPKDTDILQKFKEYNKEYSSFLHCYSFDKIINVFREFPELSPKAIIGFPIVKIKIERPELLKNIYELQELLSRLIANGDLTLADMNRNCITVIYSIFPFAVPNLLSYFDDMKIIAKFQELDILVRWELPDSSVGGELVSKAISPAKDLVSRNKLNLAFLLKKLEEQLTCAVCLDLYTNPKTLPCLHSFCQKCLEKLQRDPLENIACPSCRHITHLPPEPEGASNFPVAFHLVDLKNRYMVLKKVSNPQQVTCDNCTTAIATGYCKECEQQFLCQECIDIHKKWGPIANHHIKSFYEVVSSTSQLALPLRQETTFTCTTHTKPLEIFCETCEKVICCDCVEHHKDHKNELINKHYKEHRQELKKQLGSVKEKADTVMNAMANITACKNSIIKQGEAVERKIAVMREKIVTTVYEREVQLVKKTRMAVEDKLQVLSEQTKSVETSLSYLKNCEEYVEQGIKMSSQQQLLMSKKQMMERMSQVSQEINVEEFNPIEKADIQLIKDSDFFEALRHIGDIKYFSLDKCKVKLTGSIQQLMQEKMVWFSLSLESFDSSLLIVPVSSIKCSLVPVGRQPIIATVKPTTHPGVYNIHCSPSTCGHHQVNVQVHDVQLESTSLVIPFNPHLDTITPVRTIEDLNSPSRISISDDGNYIIVIEFWDDRVTVLDRKGERVKSFGGKGDSGEIKFNAPRGVAITPDSFVLVADEHKIHKVTINGKHIMSIGEEGSGPLQFCRPSGTVVSPITGDIYVADRFNYRIQVLTSKLAFSHSFGSEGSDEGQFNYIWGIAIDSKGLLYITDWRNHCIQKFTPGGRFVTRFGNNGSGREQVHFPQGIVIDRNDLVYVTEEKNDRVVIYTSEGEFIRSFGEHGTSEGQFNRPRGMAFDNEGKLYICDFTNNRIVIY